MPFSFHPPTGRACPVCEELHAHDVTQPIIDTHRGKASSANNFPFHNWYNFVLGYSPQFPEFMMAREHLSKTDVVLDPFMGTGTTLITCKWHEIPSLGIDANDFMVDAARTKLNWELDTSLLRRYRNEILQCVERTYRTYRWQKEGAIAQLSLFELQHGADQQDYLPYVQSRRYEMLLEKYISDKPLARALMIDDVVKETVPEGAFRSFFDLALTSIIVPISNVRYGPGFGMVTPRDDIATLDIFTEKVDRMIQDMQSVNERQKQTPSAVTLGDSRHLVQHFEPETASLIMTSPPYPGDHEYTKHTRLELTFRGYATTNQEFRVIKQRMIRASTTNIYNTDRDRDTVADFESIQTITQLIQERLDEDGATSGFEKLYTKLIWEYFGGMYMTLQDCFKVLRPGGKIAMLVSDSHAFKMVHVQTAAILQEIAVQIGFVNPEIILWQFKPSTSHKYSLRENILILSKT